MDQISTRSAPNNNKVQKRFHICQVKASESISGLLLVALQNALSRPERAFEHRIATLKLCFPCLWHRLLRPSILRGIVNDFRRVSWFPGPENRVFIEAKC